MIEPFVLLNFSTVMPRESGASSNLLTFVVTGSPAFVGDDVTRLATRFLDRSLA
jgi:hypothetical protein